MSELLPCPFCGSSTATVCDDSIWCDGCDAGVANWTITKEQLIAAWNKRPPTTEEIEADFHRATVKIMESKEEHF